jgi:hypothetical protein
MNYNIYLFSCLLKLFDKEFEQLEYDIQYEKAVKEYMKFSSSKFNDVTKSEYDCIVNYLTR